MSAKRTFVPQHFCIAGVLLFMLYFDVLALYLLFSVAELLEKL